MDFFNIIDILVLTKDGIVGVQSCGQAFSAHRIKIMEEEIVNTKKWLRTPKTRLVLIGWRKLRVPGTPKQKKFYPRIAWITIDKKGDLHFSEIKK